MAMTITNKNTYQPLFFTVREAAAILNVSDKSVRRFIKRGLLNPSKAIRKILIPREQVINFYEATK